MQTVRRGWRLKSQGSRPNEVCFDVYKSIGQTLQVGLQEIEKSFWGSLC